jgi:hypothetical protein
MSPKGFADDIRPERVVYLLRSTTLGVDAIASEVGASKLKDSSGARSYPIDVRHFDC